MNPTTVHTYIRCVNRIYVGDANNNWRELHRFETEDRAKRWQRDQEKKRPGSVSMGQPPLKVIVAEHDQAVYRERARQAEIRKLMREQEADQRRFARTLKETNDIARHRNSLTLSGKTAHLARSYVAPDHDASSFLRKALHKPQRSRNAKNTRATYGGS